MEMTEGAIRGSAVEDWGGEQFFGQKPEGKRSREAEMHKNQRKKKGKGRKWGAERRVHDELYAKVIGE